MKFTPTTGAVSKPWAISYCELGLNQLCNAVVTTTKDALNYQQAYEIVKKEMAKPSHLLEHLAGRILDALFREFELLESAWVKVSKMNPPMGGKMDCVSVTLSKNRRDA